MELAARCWLLVLICPMAVLCMTAAVRREPAREPVATWVWRWDNKTAQQPNWTMVSAPANPKLLPDRDSAWPVHNVILINLLRNLVTAQEAVGKLIPPTCNHFNASAERWRVLVDGHSHKPKGQHLLKSQYFAALQELRRATVAMRTECGMPPWWMALLQVRIFEILMDNILLVGLLHDASGYDSLPSYLMDHPWDTVRELVYVSSLDITRPFRIKWQDEDI